MTPLSGERLDRDVHADVLVQIRDVLGDIYVALQGKMQRTCEGTLQCPGCEDCTPGKAHDTTD